MALKKEFEFNGFIVSQEDSYLKVTKIVGNKDEMFARLEFLNPARKNCGYLEVTFTPTLDNTNFIAQAYEAFKLVPELADAIDA